MTPRMLAWGAFGAVAVLARWRFWPWPAPGEAPTLDLIAVYDPTLYWAFWLWGWAWSAAGVGVGGSFALSAWDVWGPRGGPVAVRGTLPKWPLSGREAEPAIVIGEQHHPVDPVEIERPTWLTVPAAGLFTGTAVFGATGSGKTAACMRPFVAQLFSWQAADPDKRASGLVLEVKGDFCHKYGSMIANIIPYGPIVFRKACYYNVIRRILAVFTGSLLCRYVPYCTIVYPSICDTQVGRTACANNPLRPPSWRE